MKWALAISLAVHLVAIGGAYAAWRGRPGGLPVRVYTVDVVSLPATARGGGSVSQTTRSPSRSTTPAAPSTRSGVTAQTAPSRETQAPRGTRRPRPPAPAPTATPKSGAGLGVGQGSGGVRVEGEKFPYPEYLRDLVARIEARWQPPPGAAGRQATVYFTVDRQGSLAASNVEAGSGQMAFDRSALAAVIEAAPYAPLPSGFQGSRLSVHLDFVE